MPSVCSGACSTCYRSPRTWNRRNGSTYERYDRRLTTMPDAMLVTGLAPPCALRRASKVQCYAAAGCGTAIELTNRNPMISALLSLVRAGVVFVDGVIQTSLADGGSEGGRLITSTQACRWFRAVRQTISLSACTVAPWAATVSPASSRQVTTSASGRRAPQLAAHRFARGRPGPGRRRCGARTSGVAVSTLSHNPQFGGPSPPRSQPFPSFWVR